MTRVNDLITMIRMSESWQVREKKHRREKAHEEVDQGCAEAEDRCEASHQDRCCSQARRHCAPQVCQISQVALNATPPGADGQGASAKKVAGPEIPEPAIIIRRPASMPQGARPMPSMPERSEGECSRRDWGPNRDQVEPSGLRDHGYRSIAAPLGSDRGKRKVLKPR